MANRLRSSQYVGWKMGRRMWHPGCQGRKIYQRGGNEQRNQMLLPGQVRWEMSTRYSNVEGSRVLVKAVSWSDWAVSKREGEESK